MMWVEIETIVFWEKNQLSALIWSKNTTLTFGWYFVVLIWLNSMFFFVSSVKIKYDDSKRQKRVKKNSFVGFDSIKNHSSYL